MKRYLKILYNIFNYSTFEIEIFFMMRQKDSLYNKLRVFNVKLSSQCSCFIHHQQDCIYHQHSEICVLLCY